MIEVMNEEEYSILSFLYRYSLQQPPPSLHSVMLLTHTITSSHIFLSEAKHCYSRNAVRFSSVVNMEKANFTNFKNS